jgi:Protein of unknown function (DUF1236)
MRKARLLSTVAAALLLTAGIASAQTMNKDEAAPNSAPAAQQKAPAEKVAPALKPGEQKASTKKGPETVGQAPKASDADKPKATEKGSMDKGPAVKGSSDANGGANMKPKAAENAQAPAGAKSSQSTASEKPATTGQGAASAAKLSTEQRSKIITIVRQHKVEPAHLNVSVSVGTRVPDSVHFYPLPVEVIAIYPEWRGYDYILVGSEILVIDPRTHEIVAILEA